MHELEINADGEASFAYNLQNGDPWHRLGTPMDGLRTVEEMLRAAKADREVVKVPLYAMTDDGFVEVEDFVATAAKSVDGTTTNVLGVVGSTYATLQNRWCLEQALAVVGASEGQAVVDTCGVLKDYREFFAFIDLGTLVIDPLGVADVLTRGMVVHTGHTGATSMRFGLTNLRAVCANTVRAGFSSAASTFSLRHTSGAVDRMAQAQQALGISTQWATDFTAQAEALLGAPGGHDVVTQVVTGLWPIDSDATERVQSNFAKRSAGIHRLYDAPTNAPAVGHNGWAVYNAIGEWLDHGRTNVDADSRAMASMNFGSEVNTLKEQAAQRILSLV